MKSGPTSSGTTGYAHRRTSRQLPLARQGVSATCFQGARQARETLVCRTARRKASRDDAFDRVAVEPARTGDPGWLARAPRCGLTSEAEHRAEMAAQFAVGPGRFAQFVARDAHGRARSAWLRWHCASITSTAATSAPVAFLEGLQRRTKSRGVAEWHAVARRSRSRVSCAPPPRRVGVRHAAGQRREPWPCTVRARVRRGCGASSALNSPLTRRIVRSRLDFAAASCALMWCSCLLQPYASPTYRAPDPRRAGSGGRGCPAERRRRTASTRSPIVLTQAIRSASKRLYQLRFDRR